MAFVINKTSKIALYGAGARGKQIYDYLIETGFMVRYIVDKNPDKVKWGQSISVIGLREVEDKLTKDFIVIISLQNGLLHDDVALEFFEKRYSKILFLPTCNKYKNEFQMRECYQNLLENTWDECKMIPQYNEMIIDKENQQLIIDDDDMVTCWVSMEYVFSENSKAKENEAWFNKHISCLTPYIALFEYIQGCGEYPKDYLECFRGNDEVAQKQLLLDRVQLWNMYEEKINTDSTYFISAPIYVKWKNNHFSIIDGHHRAVYLFTKGWYELPIRMKKEDYKKYCDYRNEQSWEGLDRTSKTEFFKAGLVLWCWISSLNNANISLSESKAMRGYFSHWINIIHGYKVPQINNEKTNEEAVVCLESEVFQKKYKKVYTLYEGFIFNKRDCIGIFIEEM